MIKFKSKHKLKLFILLHLIKYYISEAKSKKNKGFLEYNLLLSQQKFFYFLLQD